MRKRMISFHIWRRRRRPLRALRFPTQAN